MLGENTDIKSGLLLVLPFIIVALLLLIVAAGYLYGFITV